LIYISSSLSDSSTVQVKDADCLPRGYTTEYKKFDRTVSVTGEGDFASCTKHLVTLLNLNAVCLRKPCSFNGVYQPEINYNAQDFYGFSEFWYTMQGLKIRDYHFFTILFRIIDVLKLGGPYQQLTFLNASTVNQ
jgi:Golgi nucleoside diphosphatase